MLSRERGRSRLVLIGETGLGRLLVRGDDNLLMMLMIVAL